jgi:hypothetical protein
MRYILLLAIFLYTIPSSGQTFLIKEGKLADTITDPDLEYGSALPYYYSVGGKYPVGSATLLKEVQAFTEKQNNNYSGSGYITFRFIIDTTGNMLPRVKVIATDEHYKSYHFEKALINELFAYLKTLNKWRVAGMAPGKAWQYIAFITFKMKNGKVINIIP